MLRSSFKACDTFGEEIRRDKVFAMLIERGILQLVIKKLRHLMRLFAREKILYEAEMLIDEKIQHVAAGGRICAEKIKPAHEIINRSNSDCHDAQPELDAAFGGHRLL